MIDAPDVFIEKRSDPISDQAPQINYGSFALDDGNYTISKEEYDQIKKDDPSALEFLRPFIGAQEMLHGEERYCVWLKDVSPASYGNNHTIMNKVEKVREWRSKSTRKNTAELASTPSIFAEIRQPHSDYLAIPTVCSEKRNYLPIQYLSCNTIASNQLYVIPDATLYDFGILMSNVHNAWMRAVCGRLETRLRYSSAIVYNNFPWPELTETSKDMISATAKEILDARSDYPDCSLEILYDKNKMPERLVKAHIANDRTVMKAYGFNIKDTSEELCVAALMKLYQDKIGG